MKTISLRVGTDCSGLETPLLALTQLGITYEHIWSCDNDMSIKTHILNYFNPVMYFDSIYDRNHYDLPDIDLYVCGFSCQPFSSIGLRKGFNDKLNGSVFFEAYNTIKIKQPKYFILENVKSILSHNSGKTIQTIKEMLGDLTDYNVCFHTLNTNDYGVPQHRQRLYIIGVQNESFKLEPFLDTCQPLSDFIDFTMIGQTASCLIPRRQNVVNCVALAKHMNLSDNWIITSGASLSYCRSYKDCCPCITANCRFYYISSLQRFLTPRELSNLQGFPTDFPIASNGQAYKQIGNAMSLNVIKHILKSMLT